MSAAVDTPDMLFLIGMYASGVEDVGQLLTCFGLQVLTTSPDTDAAKGSIGGLSRFNAELLTQIGATWTEPALLPRLELMRRLAHRKDEAREVFEAAISTATDSLETPLAWADPRNTLLAQFWIETLHIDPSMMLVHRNPQAVGELVAGAGVASFEDSLILWDEYNRMALSLWEEFPGVVVSIESFETEVRSGVRGLRDYLDRVGIKTTEEQARAAAEWCRESIPEAIKPDRRPVQNKFVVLDRVLSRADFTDTVDREALMKEFADYYDEEYYEHYGNEGDAPYRVGEEQWTTFFSRIAERIARDLQPKSVLDAGCAIGFLVEALRTRNIDAWGVDVSEWAISQVEETVKDFCSVASLTDEIEGQFDLITLIEVIEHMPAAVAGDVVANITRHASQVLFSSTSDGFEEATHINVQTPDYWAGLFAANGFVRDFDYDASYLSPDAILFRRGRPGADDLIRGYERAFWRLRDVEKRERDRLAMDIVELVGSVHAQSDRAVALERINDDMAEQNRQLHSRLEASERQRHADTLAWQREALRLERVMTTLRHELHAATRQTEGLTGQISAMEATRMFRYWAKARSLARGFRGRRRDSER